MTHEQTIGPDPDPESFSHTHFPKTGQGNKGPPNHTDRNDAMPSASHSSKEHAVISMFDLFSIGIGPSSSHTVGPMRAGAIFVHDLRKSALIESVARIKLALYGSLAATGKGHMTPQALLLGLEGAECETVDTETVPIRFEAIKKNRCLTLGKDMPEKGPVKVIEFDYDRDLEWKWGQTLPMHSNGMRFSVFNRDGDLLATNDFYSIGGGFVVNGLMAVADKPGPRPAACNNARSENDPDAVTNALASLNEAAITPSQKESHPVDVMENVYYKSITRDDVEGGRREGTESNMAFSQPALPSPSKMDSSEQKAPKEPRFPFRTMSQLLALTRKHNLTIAQIVYENELTWYTPEEIEEKIINIWNVMDEGIRAGVLSEQEVLPGSLQMKRRAPKLYNRLIRGLYMGPRRLGHMRGSSDTINVPLDSHESPSSAAAIASSSNASGGYVPSIKTRSSSRVPTIRGSFQHEIMPVPPRRTNFPAMDWLSCWAIATNEQVAAGGRIVIAPTLGAAGIIPSVLRYVVEFVALTPEDEENLVKTFLLTAAAIGMLFKRGATISAAEGGCMAEVGTSCSMAAAAFAACMGGSPEVIEQAAETAIEHNLGLTCDPVDGLVQAPCIERNAVGAVKAVVSANLALSTEGIHTVTLDEAIQAARLTAADMHTKYKETSLSGLATTVKIPVAVPDC